jgi:SH3 domain-containing protein
MTPDILKSGRLSGRSANDCFTQYGERCRSECFALLKRQPMEPVRMAQRVSGFARRPAGGTRAAERARVNNDPTGQPIPLDLVSVVAPYKRYRGLSLRVEHLAHGARLSHGRNNGDRSWSVAPDELDGLEYLPPNDSYESHTLAVRIISLDGGDGESLAVIDLPIVGRAGAETSMDAPSGALHAEVQRLRDELVKVKSSLAARDTDLATARRNAEDAERSRQSLKMEFSAAEESWDRELRKQLTNAAAEASANLEKLRSEWDAEQSTRRSKTDAGAQKSVEDARKRWQQESQAALAKAEAEWNIAEMARMASVEAAWHEQSAKTMSELRARAEEAEAAAARAKVAVAKNDTTEMRRLREELATTHAELSKRNTELAEARATAELAQSHSHNPPADLKKAEQAWKAAESVRLAGAEARWKEQSAKAVADVTARLEQTEAALAEARAATEAARVRSRESATEVKKAEQAWKVAEAARLASAEMAWKEQMAKAVGEVTAHLEHTEAALAEARAEAEAVRAQSRGSAADLKKAEQAWKAAESVRLSAAESRWKEQMAKAVGEVTARLEQAEASVVEARALAEVRQHQVVAAKASLAAREAELSHARAGHDELRVQTAAESEDARKRWQEEMDAALAKAQLAFKAGETARLAAAEAQWKLQFAANAAETAAQLQQVEADLAQAQADLQTQKAEAEENLRRLRNELATTQTALLARESEISDALSEAEQARSTADHSLQSVAAEIEKARQKWKRESDAALAKAEKKWRSEEAPRLAAAEARWQETVAARLEDAQARFERADSALSDSKACSEALRHELAAAQASLAHREIEVAEARAALDQERVRMNQVPISLEERKPSWEADADERRAMFRRRLFRDFAIVACLAGLAFMLFPRVQPVVAEVWPHNLSIRNNLQPLLQMAGLSDRYSPTAPAELQPAGQPHALVNVRVANLRENPSIGAAVVVKLARNVEVTTLKRRGDWMFVQIGDGAEQKQGWVSSTVLKQKDAQALPHE